MPHETFSLSESSFLGSLEHFDLAAGDGLREKFHFLERLLSKSPKLPPLPTQCPSIQLQKSFSSPVFFLIYRNVYPKVKNPFTVAWEISLALRALWTKTL